jgi:hypothetical protein
MSFRFVVVWCISWCKWNCAGFNCFFISVLPLEIASISKRTCLCLVIFYDLRWEVVIRFVDIGVIVHYWLKFPFPNIILLSTNNSERRGNIYVVYLNHGGLYPVTRNSTQFIGSVIMKLSYFFFGVGQLVRNPNSLNVRKSNRPKAR